MSMTKLPKQLQDRYVEQIKKERIKWTNKNY
jgi:hypothetical protein